MSQRWTAALAVLVVLAFAGCQGSAPAPSPPSLPLKARCGDQCTNGESILFRGTSSRVVLYEFRLYGDVDGWVATYRTNPAPLDGPVGILIDMVIYNETGVILTGGGGLCIGAVNNLLSVQWDGQSVVKYGKPSDLPLHGSLKGFCAGGPFSFDLPRDESNATMYVQIATVGYEEARTRAEIQIHSKLGQGDIIHKVREEYPMPGAVGLWSLRHGIFPNVTGYGVRVAEGTHGSMSVMDLRGHGSFTTNTSTFIYADTNVGSIAGAATASEAALDLLTPDGNRTRLGRNPLERLPSFIYHGFPAGVTSVEASLKGSGSVAIFYADGVVFPTPILDPFSAKLGQDS